MCNIEPGLQSYSSEVLEADRRSDTSSAVCQSGNVSLSYFNIYFLAFFFWALLNAIVHSTQPTEVIMVG